MCNKGWLKRALPFIGTFAFGIFVASFFVSVTPTSGHHGCRFKRFEEMQQIRLERDQLRDENLRLRNKVNNNWQDNVEIGTDVTAPVIDDVPPPPPMAPRHRR